VGTFPERNADRNLAAAGLGLGHLLLAYRALVLAELTFELEVRTRIRVANVLSHQFLPFR